MKKTILLFTFSFSLFTLSAQIITTVAGTGTAGFNSDGIQATASELNSDFGIAVDNAGNIYIGDTFNQRVRKINNSGIITTIAGTGTQGYSGDGGPATAARVWWPCGLKVDAAGNIYFCDYINARIRMINTSGIITTIAGNGSPGYGGDGGPATAAELNEPTELVLDAAGDIIICDYNNSRIRKVTTSGIITTIAGTGAAGFAGDGGPATAADLKLPEGVGIDAAGNLYIADTQNFRIRMVNTSGTISTLAGIGTNGYSGDGGPATAAKVSNVFGVAIDVAGNIYTTDNANTRIRMINTNGIITTIAGTGTHGYTGDGAPATAAKIDAGGLIAVNTAGTIYFGDRYNNVVRKLTSILGVNEINNNSSAVKLYPNPNHGAFTLQVDPDSYRDEKVKGESMLEIYNMLGKEIYSRTFNIQNSTFNISGQPAGIYMYRIIDADGKQTGSGKFIIE